MWKTAVFFCVAATFLFAHGDVTPQRHDQQRVQLLGSKECTWGPSYWCSNLTTSAGCRATKHCAQTVWLHRDYPVDDDSICQTCLDMVKQARDQLESNETQEEIKEVFEGSCKLIPIKIVNEECCKLADDFIPDLIDTLASEMNPQTVCSVAGLCNNRHYDELLAAEQSKAVKPAPKQNHCQGCHQVVDLMEKKFNAASRDEVLQNLMQMCARMGSFSDACTNIAITYFNEIYERMQKEFKADSICVLSGECSVNFHVHPEIEITPMSDVGVIAVEDDNPACKLCVQLVGHLRDLLIADTTETEFQKVLQGLCKQTGKFTDECIGIVNEYYPMIYKYLVDGLNSTVVCDFAGICPGPGFSQSAPIAPLLSYESQQKLMAPPSTVRSFELQLPEDMQLPIERMHSPFMNQFSNQLCAFCQYFLHYVQQEITDPKTEDQLKELVDKACERLPNSVSETCVAFVNSYGEAVVALLAEEIDPATICPLMRVCPGGDMRDIEVFMQGTPRDKPNCPLCLFAVTKLEEMVKENRTRVSIKDALKNLCGHLENNLKAECQDFVDSYTDELVEMLVDDFKPQEICVYLKICKDDRPPKQHINNYYEGSINTNEIPDFTANGRPLSVDNKQTCPLCEFVMQQLQSQLADNRTEEEIKEALHNVCKAMPQTLRKECDGFVTKYGDLVLQLLVSSIEPKEICVMLKLCDSVLVATNGPVLVKHVGDGGPQCFLCKRIISAIEQVIGGISEDQLEAAVKGICSILPRDEKDGCNEFINKYGHEIYLFLKEGTQPGEICSLLFLCGQNPIIKAMVESSYTCAVCETTVDLVESMLANPNMIHSAEHVLEKACAAVPIKYKNKCVQLVDKYGDKIFHYVSTIGAETTCKEINVCPRHAARVHLMQKRDVLVGSNKCTWGPSYWCKTTATATECGDGAHTHCKERVWKADKPADEV